MRVSARLTLIINVIIIALARLACLFAPRSQARDAVQSFRTSGLGERIFRDGVTRDEGRNEIRSHEDRARCCRRHRDLAHRGRRPADPEGDDDHRDRADDDGQSLWRFLVAGLFAVVPHLWMSRPLRLFQAQAGRNSGGEVGGDRSADVALYAAQGIEAPRRRPGADVRRCRAFAQAHPHRSRERAKLLRRDGDRDRARRRRYVRHQDQGSNRQSRDGAVRSLHRHGRRSLRQARARGRQEIRLRLGALSARGVSGRPARRHPQESGMDRARWLRHQELARCRDLPADARARAACHGAAQRRSAGRAPDPAAARATSRRPQQRERAQDRRHRGDVRRLQQHDGAVDRRAAAQGGGARHQSPADR
jgi:hypothetical protein